MKLADTVVRCVRARSAKFNHIPQILRTTIYHSLINVHLSIANIVCITSPLNCTRESITKTNTNTNARTQVLHLKRFTQTMEGFSVRSKKRTPIQIPLKIDMSPFVIGPQSRHGSAVYEPRSESSLWKCGGGHYTAQIKHGSEGKWYDCNDSQVTLFSSSSARVDPVSAYALFYRRCDVKSSSCSNGTSI